MSKTTLLVNDMRHCVFNHCLVFWPDMTHIWCVSHFSCGQECVLTHLIWKEKKKRVFAHFTSNQKIKVLSVRLLWLIKNKNKSMFGPVNAAVFDGLYNTEAWVDCAVPTLICCICNPSLCSPVQQSPVQSIRYWFWPQLPDWPGLLQSPVVPSHFLPQRQRLLRTDEPQHSVWWVPIHHWVDDFKPHSCVCVCVCVSAHIQSYKN